MQLIIHTETDVNKLQGKFVLQVDNEQPDMTLMDCRWDFAKAKRIRMVVGFGFVDLFGMQTRYDSYEKFKNVFNHYLFDHMIAEGKTSGGRFHRLLTNAELSYLFEKIKEENY